MADEIMEDIKRPKGQTRVVDKWGNMERRKRNVDFGLSSIVLPPYTRGRVATYRVIANTVINPSSTFKEPAEPKTLLLEGKYKFFDKGEEDLGRKWKIIKNIFGPGDIVIDKVSGKQVIEETIEPVVLLNGFLRVNIDQEYRKYVFMELHPWNASNKFRPTDYQPKFLRTDLSTNKSLAYRAAEQDLGLEAEMSVMKMTKDQIIGYATTCNIPTTEHGKPRELTGIKSDLRVYARTDPRGFFAMHNNLGAAVKMNMLDACNFGIVEYVADTRKFIVPEVDDAVICVHLADEDPNEALIKEMMKESNAEVYKAICNRLDYWHYDSK